MNRLCLSAVDADCRSRLDCRHSRQIDRRQTRLCALRPVQPSRVECRHRAARISGRISDAFSPSTYTKARHLSPGHLFLNADYKGKRSPYTITERRVPELIPVLCSQAAGDVSHKTGGRLPYFPPGLQLPAQPLRGLLPVLLLGQRHNGCEQFA